jgi:CheY-like chemotaxis protein
MGFMAHSKGIVTMDSSSDSTSPSGLDISALFDATPSPYLVLSSEDKDRERSLASGFDNHLVKPVDTKAPTSILSSIGHG